MTKSLLKCIYHQVLASIPQHLRSDVSVHLHKQILMTEPSFKDLSETSARHIASKMERIHIAPGDLLIDRGEEIKHIYFVVSGSLEVLQRQQIVALLGMYCTIRNQVIVESRCLGRCQQKLLSYCL